MFPLQCCSICTGCPFCIHFWSCFLLVTWLPLPWGWRCIVFKWVSPCIAVFCPLWYPFSSLASVWSSSSPLSLSRFYPLILSLSLLVGVFSGCFFYNTGICSLTFSSSARSFTCFLHLPCPVLLISLMRVSVCMLSIRFACSICFLHYCVFYGDVSSFYQQYHCWCAVR